MNDIQPENSEEQQEPSSDWPAPLEAELRPRTKPVPDRDIQIVVLGALMGVWLPDLGG